jgi:uncharacterized protein YgiM (DUF1202 family)
MRTAAMFILAMAVCGGGAWAQDRVTPLDRVTPVVPRLTPLPSAPQPVVPPPPAVAVPAPAPAPVAAPPHAQPATAAPPVAPAPAKTAGMAKAMWTTASVTVRSGPSTTAGVVDEVTPGTAVSALSAAAGWTRVRVNGGTAGYIRSTYLSARPPAVAACAAQPLDPGAPEPVAGAVVTVAGAAYLRSGPSCGEHTLDVLEPGASVTVIETAGDWVAVSGQGWERAYLHRSLIGAGG